MGDFMNRFNFRSLQQYQKRAILQVSLLIFVVG